MEWNILLHAIYHTVLVRCDYSEDDLEALKQIPKDSITLQKYGVLLFAVCIIECDFNALFRELGRGAFGEVWEGTVEDIMGPGTGTHRVAIKVCYYSAY